MKRIIALLLAVLMIFGLAACDTAPADDNSGSGEDTNLIGVAMPTKDLQRWNQDGENMKKQLEDAGYKVDLQYAANDVQTQASQIENMISNGCEVLVVASIDGEALGTVMAQAKEAGIPVVAYDRLIMNSDAVSYYATFDNWKVGEAQGQYIVDALDLENAGDKTYNIEYITGDPGDNNINFFFDGALSVLKPYIDAGTLVTPSGQTEKATVATVEWSTKNAQDRFDTILASGYTGKYPVLTGQDCDVANVKNMLADKQSMSVFKDTRTLASQVVKMVDALMKGEEPPVNDTKTYDNGTGVIPSYLCEPVACTKDNYKEILIDSGYYTEDQVA